MFVSSSQHKADSNSCKPMQMIVFICACQFLQLFFFPVECFQRTLPIFFFTSVPPDYGLVLLCILMFLFKFPSFSLCVVNFSYLKSLLLLMVPQNLHDKHSQQGFTDGCFLNKFPPETWCVFMCFRKRRVCLRASELPLLLVWQLDNDNKSIIAI